MQRHRVRALLMGGQACVFYGAAQFSRDIDFAILADVPNLTRLRKVLAELRAKPIAVPPPEIRHLRGGHSLHFRCRHPEVLRVRVDVMAKMRGVESFAKLWRRRTVIQLEDGTVGNLLSLPDLVQAKKTQRDKDWPMIRRLLEANYFEHRNKSNLAQRKYWMMEMRTASILIDLVKKYPSLYKQTVAKRPLLKLAFLNQPDELELALHAEESGERERDRIYWGPLLMELEKMRHPR